MYMHMYMYAVLSITNCNLSDFPVIGIRYQYLIDRA